MSIEHRTTVSNVKDGCLPWNLRLKRSRIVALLHRSSHGLRASHCPTSLACRLSTISSTTDAMELCLTRRAFFLEAVLSLNLAQLDKLLPVTDDNASFEAL